MIRSLATAVTVVVLGVAAVLAAVVDPAPLAAQEFGGGGDPKADLGKVAFDPPTAVRGGTARIVIEIVCAPDSHIYAQSEIEEKRPVFKWVLPPGWTAGKTEDLTKPHEFTGFGEAEMVVEGTARIAQSFTIGPDAALGKVEIRGTGAWQVCNEGLCGQVRDVAIAATVEIGEAPEAGTGTAGGVEKPQPAPPAPAGAAGAGSASNEPEKHTWGDILGQAVFFGLLTVLTPCVFPLLPVTVSFFSKQKGPALPRALVYFVGIVFTIVVIGLIFKSGLDVMARGWIFNLAVGLLFLVLSLSLFGMFDLRLPAFLTDFSTSKSGSGGLVGPFFMAVTLALTSFSCSMPFLATLFTQFDRGDSTQAVVALTVYGSTMAFPFFLCTLFPAALQALPGRGDWMNAIKVTMGFVEFALAFKFLRTVTMTFDLDWLPRGFVLAIWAACAFGAALYLFGHLVLPHDTKPESIGVVRLVFAITFLAAGLYLVPGVSGRPLGDWIEGFIQTQEAELAVAEPGGGRPGGGGAGGGAAAGGHIAWDRNDWDGALARAKAVSKPVLLDFTGVG